MSKKVTFKAKLTCDGCGAQHYDLPVSTLITKKQFCTRECLHVHYFNFPTLQNHYHEQLQSKGLLA